ncbi:MAG TPA: hypothetical protein VFS76_15405 [Pyrinomonadaceae bacterium]|nr:hypothetical protein [Pyrinomonadaceae bacterium]
MPLVQKVTTALGLVLILFIAGVVSVRAQAQAVVENSPTSEPKKAEAANPPLATSQSSEADKTSEISRSPTRSKTVAVANTPIAAAGTTSEASSPASQSAPADKWQFQFSPYFWLAGLHGTTGTPNRTVQVEESFGDIFDSLNFAFMAMFEARKDKFVVLTDLEYVSIEDDRATPGPLFSDVNAKIKTFIFDPEVGYRLFEDPDKGAFVDVVGGARIWRISTDFTFGPGILPGTQVDASRTWVDGVGGLRGKAALSDKVFLTGKFDLGGGGSKFTYQLFGGGGYNVTPNIALIFAYRVLDVNYDRNNFVYDMNQRGPIMGVGFKF